MTFFLAFYLVLSGDPAPHKGTIEQPSLEACRDELGKLMNQPLPREFVSAQYSCIVFKKGDPT